MTDPRKQAFAPYARCLADLLALKDWLVKVNEEPPSDGADATMWLAVKRKRAEVCLSEAFLDMTPEEQRQRIVHELIHCHLEPAWEIAAESLPAEALPGFARMMEYAIDGLADGIAPHLPPPDAAEST